MKLKRILMLTALAISFAVSSQAQVRFSQLKLFVADIHDFSHLNLEMKFKATSDKPVKYVNVYFSLVNEVGDAIYDRIVGGVNANTEHTKFHHVRATGPFKPGKSNKKRFGPYYVSGKKPTVFPHKLVIDYMGSGNESDTIIITKDNIETYFPCTKWIDVNYKDGIF